MTGRELRLRQRIDTLTEQRDNLRDTLARAYGVNHADLTLLAVQQERIKSLESQLDVQREKARLARRALDKIRQEGQVNGRTCRECGEKLPASAFDPHRRVCRPCRSQMTLRARRKAAA